MLVVYKGRSAEGRFVQIEPGYEIPVPYGVPVELPDAIAASLLARDSGEWSTPKPPKPAKADKE